MIVCVHVCVRVSACFVLLAYSPGSARFYLQEVQADWLSYEPCFPWPHTVAVLIWHLVVTVRVQEDSSKQTHKTNWIWSWLLMNSVNIKALWVIMMRTRSDKTLLDSFCCFNVVMAQAVHAAFSFSLVFFIKSLHMYPYTMLYKCCSYIRHKVFPCSPEWLQIDSPVSPEGCG